MFVSRKPTLQGLCCQFMGFVTSTLDCHLMLFAMCLLYGSCFQAHELCERDQITPLCRCSLAWLRSPGEVVEGDGTLWSGAEQGRR